MLRAAGCGFGHGPAVSAGGCSYGRAAPATRWPRSPPCSRRARSESSSCSCMAAFVDRYLRPEARPRRERWQAAAHQAAVGLRDGQDRRLMKSPWEFKNYGQSGMPISSSFPNLRIRRRPVRGSLHGRRRRGPRRRAATDLHRHVHFHPSQHGLLGALRPRHGEPRSSRLHHDQAHAGAWRSQELELRLPARRCSGHRHRQCGHEGRRHPEGAHRIPGKSGPHATSSGTSST